MGGKSIQSSTQTSDQHVSQTTQPWERAQPQLDSILNGVNDIPAQLNGTQNQALDALSANAKGGNPYAGMFGNLATDLLGSKNNYGDRINGAFDTLNANLAPTARGDFLDPAKNPFFSATTSAISDDVQNRVNSMFAGAGRDLSGANQGVLASEIAKATAPVYANAYAQERGNQLGAANAMFSGANTATGMFGNFDQQALANRQAGLGAAGAALDAQNYGPAQQLAIEAQRRGIPLSVLQQLAGIVGPIAGLGSSTSGTTSGTTYGAGSKTLSGAEQFGLIAGGIGKLFGGGGSVGAGA